MTKILILIISLLALSNAWAYDLSKKFGVGGALSYPIPVWGNTFNDIAGPEWGAELHGRYHIDQSIGWDINVSKQEFKDTAFGFENASLLAFWRIAGEANLTPIFALGAGLTRIDHYSPHNLKLSFLGRLGAEYAMSTAFSLGIMGEYQYVSKIMGKMPTRPAHVISPMVSLTWYFGVKEEREEMDNSKNLDKEKPSDEVKTKSSATRRKEVRPDLMVQFDFGKATVRPEYYSSLKRVAEQLKDSDELEGYIEGHTDDIGPEKFNDVLSIKRAQAVLRKLIEYGAEERKLKAEGFGEDRPIADNSTEEGREKNRRSAIYISVKTKVNDVM